MAEKKENWRRSSAYLPPLKKLRDSGSGPGESLRRGRIVVLSGGEKEWERRRRVIRGKSWEEEKGGGRRKKKEKGLYALGTGEMIRHVLGCKLKTGVILFSMFVLDKILGLRTFSKIVGEFLSLVSHALTQQGVACRIRLKLGHRARRRKNLGLKTLHSLSPTNPQNFILLFFVCGVYKVKKCLGFAV